MEAYIYWYVTLCLNRGKTVRLGNNASSVLDPHLVSLEHSQKNGTFSMCIRIGTWISKASRRIIGFTLLA